jgi:hypothetical protein
VASVLLPELLDRDGILDSLAALAQELGSGRHQHVLVLVGGAQMTLHGLRSSTHDVDSARRLDAELVGAAQRVAHARALRADWLNAGPLPWRPQTLVDAECEVVFESPRLRVLGAPLRQVFLMKLVSNRARDIADIPLLWPHSGFATAEEAVEHLYVHAYPGEDRDPHLAQWLRDVAGAA